MGLGFGGIWSFVSFTAHYGYTWLEILKCEDDINGIGIAFLHRKGKAYLIPKLVHSQF